MAEAGLLFCCVACPLLLRFDNEHIFSAVIQLGIVMPLWRHPFGVFKEITNMKLLLPQRWWKQCSVSGHPPKWNLMDSRVVTGQKAGGTPGPPDGPQNLLSKAKVSSTVQQKRLLSYLSELQCQERAHDKPVWKSRFPSCPLDQVSTWYVVLPARPAGLFRKHSQVQQCWKPHWRPCQGSEILRTADVQNLASTIGPWLPSRLQPYPCSLPAAAPASLPCLQHGSPPSTSGPSHFLLWTSGISTWVCG